MMYSNGVTPDTHEGPSGGRTGFRGNPYWLFAPRPVREERLRAYIRRQHRAGRPLSEILRDRRVAELGGLALVWRVVVSPATIHALGDDAREQIQSCIDSAGRVSHTSV
jgi:hypothetical protein